MNIKSVLNELGDFAKEHGRKRTQPGIVNRGQPYRQLGGYLSLILGFSIRNPQWPLTQVLCPPKAQVVIKLIL